MADMNERVARLEGRMDSAEHRLDGHNNRIVRAEVDIDSMREDNKELMRFLDRATGAFNGMKWTGIVLSSLIGLGLLSITFGGGG